MNKFKNFAIIFLINTAVFFALTPVFEYIFSLFTNSVFVFNFTSNLMNALELGLLFTVIDDLILCKSHENLKIRWK